MMTLLTSQSCCLPSSSIPVAAVRAGCERARVLARASSQPSQRVHAHTQSNTYRNKTQAQTILSTLAGKDIPKVPEPEQKTERKQEQEEEQETRKEQRQLREEGPLFQWVGRCDPRQEECSRFNPKLFSPISETRQYRRLPNHRLQLEVTGPGVLDVTFDMGQRYNCRKKSINRKSQNLRVSKKINLRQGRQVIDLTNLVSDWKREYAEVRVQKGIYTNMIRLEHWKKCR